MDIILIGSGNTATVIGRKSLVAGHRIVQVYSRNGSHANRLASRLGATSTSYISTIEKRADLMIIALQDEALRGFAEALGAVHCPAVHTAGALSMNEISGLSSSHGVLYPLQSLRRDIENIPPLTILVDGNNPASRNMIKAFASTIAESVLEADDETRLKYHLAATLVNNFTNHLFAMAASFCEKEKISFAVLQPLMEETVLRLRTVSPLNTQTGPAIRNDLVTIQKHRDLLKDYPVILSFYEKFTEEIQKTALVFKL
jgi:predicted short-subunit dehydrogenase-like oxidoreductase (DUF2520 family)